MDVTLIPFNALIGINLSNKDTFLLMLHPNITYTNHVGTVHASALFSLAEATCAQFLLNQFKQISENYIPLVRKVTTKYTKLAMGAIFSKAELIEDTIENVSQVLIAKNKVSLKLKIQLYNSANEQVMWSEFEWFVAKSDKIIE